MTEKSGFKCDACDMSIPKNTRMWSLKDDAPVRCTDIAFCLCEACGPSALSTSSDGTWLEMGEIKYMHSVHDLFLCHAHYADGDDKDEVCKCRCSICNRNGHKGAEKEWFVGTMSAFITESFSFLVCPDCVPRSQMECNSAKESWVAFCNSAEKVWVVSNKHFFEKWCVPHMECTVLCKQDIERKESLRASC